MEIFLHKLVDILAPGDVFSLEAFGVFEVVRPDDSEGLMGQDDVLILYRTEKAFGNGEELVFRVSVAKSETSNPLDLYFSLGIAKPLIPLKGQKFVADSLPASPLELRKLAEMKADSIIAKGSISRGTSVTDYQSIRNIHAEQGAASQGAKKKHLTWEFGDDWKKEYEAATILSGTDTGIVDEFPLEAMHPDNEMNWDFGGDEEAPPLTPHERTAENKAIDTAKTPDPVLPFSQVKSSTRELEIDFSDFEDDSEASAEDFDTIFKKSLAANVLSTDALPPEEPYKQVRSTRELPAFHIPEEPAEEEEIDRAGQEDFSKLVIDLKDGLRSTSISENETFQARGIRDTIDFHPPKKESSALKWYVLAFILFTVSGSLVYVKMYGTPEWARKYWQNNIEQGFTKPIPVVVERDYSFPVTFPYPARTVTPIASKPVEQAEPVTETKKAEEQKVETAPIKQESVKPQPVKPQEKPVGKTEKVIEKPKLVEAKKEPVKPETKPAAQVQKNIFKEADGYQVQVMSLNREDQAEAEAARLRAKGYKVTVVSANVPGKGLHYRVRVGSFATVEEASKAAAKLGGK